MSFVAYLNSINSCSSLMMLFVSSLLLITAIYFLYVCRFQVLKPIISILADKNIVSIIKSSGKLKIEYIASIFFTGIIPLLFIQQLSAEQKLISSLTASGTELIAKHILIVALCHLAYELAWRGRDIIKIHLSSRIKHKVLSYFMKQMLHKEYNFFRKHGSIPFVADQTASACDKISMLLIDTIRELVFMTVSVCAMYSVSFVCGLLMSCFGLAWVMGSCFLLKLLSAASTEHSEACNHVVQGCEDAISNILIVKAMKTYNLENSKNNALLDIRTQKEIYLKKTLWKAWLIQGGIMPILLAITIFHVLQSNPSVVIVGTCSLLIRLFSRLMSVLWSASDNIGEYIKESGKLLYGLKLLNEAKQQQNIIKYETNTSDNIAIRCKKVEFRYHDQGQIFKFDIAFQRNKMTAIKGRSGCGKSTLAKIILGILTPYKGSIHIYSKSLSYMPQNPTVFRNSLKYNISYGSIASYISQEQIMDLDKISEVLTKVKFTMPTHIDYDLKINNNILSGGQLQKLALARSLYRNSDILILDEPTSALDKQSMEDIISVLQSLDDKTRIIVSHSDEMIEGADNIIEIS